MILSIEAYENYDIINRGFLPVRLASIARECSANKAKECNPVAATYA